ncbi:MAG: hypothetical protein ACRD6W_01605 [Nitrososphaerales archaeon]
MLGQFCDPACAVCVQGLESFGYSEMDSLTTGSPQLQEQRVRDEGVNKSVSAGLLGRFRHDPGADGSLDQLEGFLLGPTRGSHQELKVEFLADRRRSGEHGRRVRPQTRHSVRDHFTNARGKCQFVEITTELVPTVRPQHEHA